MKGLATLALLLSIGAPGVAQIVGEPAVPPLDEMPPPAPPATLAVEVAPDSIAIGDRIQAALIVRAEQSLSEPPRFPVWEEHWGDAEILAVEEPIDEGGGVWRQQLALAVFKTGLATLPSVEVAIPTSDLAQTIASEPTLLRVGSVLPESEEEIAPQPPEPVRRLPVGSRFWWVMAILALACAILGYFLLRAADRIHRALEALTLSPIDAFTQAVGRLRQESDAERMFTALSLELRRYLGRAIGFPAAEGTTTEVQRRLREHELPPEIIRETSALLREVDQIKFARVSAETTRAGRRLDDAEKLVRDVEEWLRPPAEDQPQPEMAA